MFETICHLEVVIKKTSKNKEPIPLIKYFVTFNMQIVQYQRNTNTEKKNSDNGSNCIKGFVCLELTNEDIEFCKLFGLAHLEIPLIGM